MVHSKVFWDTNILVDLLLARPIELEATEQMLKDAIMGTLEIFVAESVISTALYLTRHQSNPALALYSFLRTGQVLPASTALLQSALSSSFTDKEDAILYHLAAHHRMDAFITRNKKHFSRHAVHGTPVMTPKEFVKRMQ